MGRNGADGCCCEEQPEEKKKGGGCLANALVALFILSTFVWYTVLEPLKDALDAVSRVVLDPEALGINEGAGSIHKEARRVIAVFGLDSRSPSSRSRSDTILIISFGEPSGGLSVTSILRDTLVDIPGKGFSKINAAYAQGGPQLALAAINSNFDTQITDFVTFDFFSVAAAVDAMGGVEVEITEKTLKDFNAVVLTSAVILGVSADVPPSKAGVQVLDGLHAVAYLRMRNTGSSDFDRTSRQRNFAAAAYAKMRAEFSASYAAKLLEAVSAHIETSLTDGELALLAWDLMGLSGGVSAAGLTVNLTARTYDGQSVLMPDTLEDLAGELHGRIYGEAPYSPTEELKKRSRELAGILRRG